MAFTSPTIWTRGMLVNETHMNANIRDNQVALKRRDDEEHVAAAFTLQPADINTPKVVYFDDLVVGYNTGINFDQLAMGYAVPAVSVRWNAVIQVVTTFDTTGLQLGGYIGYGVKTDGTMDGAITIVAPGPVAVTNSVGYQALTSSSTTWGVTAMTGVVRPRIGVRLSGAGLATTGLITGQIIFTFRSYQP